MQRAVELFKTLGDETRLRILNLLGEREVCVCEMVEILRLGQSKVSRHLAALRHAGLVDCRREGMWVIYFLAPACSPLHQMMRDWLMAMRHENVRSRNDLEALREFATHHGHCLGTSREPPTPAESRESMDRQVEVCGAAT